MKYYLIFKYMLWPVGCISTYKTEIYPQVGYLYKSIMNQNLQKVQIKDTVFEIFQKLQFFYRIIL